MKRIKTNFGVKIKLNKTMRDEIEKEKKNNNKVIKNNKKTIKMMGTNLIKKKLKSNA